MTNPNPDPLRPDQRERAWTAQDRRLAECDAASELAEKFRSCAHRTRCARLFSIANDLDSHAARLFLEEHEFLMELTDGRLDENEEARLERLGNQQAHSVEQHEALMQAIQNGTHSLSLP